MFTRRDVLKRVVAYGGLGLGSGLYAWRLEPHWLEIVERPLPIANLPKDLVGSTLAQLSDLHIGPRVDDGYLRNVFDRVRQLSPDFVVYTGDLTDLRPSHLDHAASLIPHLPLGRLGTFGSFGNHDYGPDWRYPQIATRVAVLAKASGIAMLRNETAEIKGLHFAGIDDLWAGRFRPEAAFANVPSRVATIALSHNPDTADHPNWGSFSGWILAGHTHGGQCKPPFLPPPVLPVENRRYTAGEFALSGGRTMYISRGVGHTMQVRFNVRPEVTLFRLTAV